jgi:hypothetical protein
LVKYSTTLKKERERDKMSKKEEDAEKLPQTTASLSNQETTASASASKFNQHSAGKKVIFLGIFVKNLKYNPKKQRKRARIRGLFQSLASRQNDERRGQPVQRHH